MLKQLLSYTKNTIKQFEHETESYPTVDSTSGERIRTRASKGVYKRVS